MADTDEVVPQGSGPVDLLANPLGDLDLSHGGPLLPTVEAPECSSKGDVNLTTPTHCDHDESVSPGEGDGEGNGNGDGFSDSDDITSPRLDKGKAPETAFLPPGSERKDTITSHEEDTDSLQQARHSNGSSTDDENPEPPPELITTTTSDEKTETVDDSYPASLFDEAQDKPPSSQQKQKETAAESPPPTEEEAAAAAAAAEPSFHPPNPDDPDWDKSAGRPPQKQPIRFRDAVGRNFLFPWEKAKTWVGMKKLIQSCMMHIEVIGPHVVAGHYDLSANLPFPMDGADAVRPPGTTATATASSSEPGPSSIASQQPQTQTSSSSSSFVVIPELWEDTVEPGMIVVQHLWPFQSPNFVMQPSQQQPPPPSSSSHHLPQALFGRGRGRGHWRGIGTFRGGRGGHGFGAMSLPGVARPPMSVTDERTRTRGKTRKRQDNNA